MASNTTVIWDSGTTAYYSASGLFTPLSAFASTLDGILSTGIIIPTATLYVPYSVESEQAVDVESFVKALNPTIAGQAPFVGYTVMPGAPNSAPVSATINLYPDTTLYIPYSVAAPKTNTLSISSLGNKLTKFASSNTIPLVTSSTSTSTTTSASTSDTSSTSTPNTSSSTTSTTSTTRGTSTPPIRHTVSQSTFDGAVAGGAVGGFIVGIMLGLLIFFLCFRRRRNRTVNAPVVAGLSSANSTDGVALTKYTDNQGWEKHLPQEKNDGFIVDRLKSLFELLRVFVDANYDMQPSGSLSASNRNLLEAYPCDDLSGMIPTTTDIVPILEGMLVRWIVHKVSLRSSGPYDILPIEWTNIPQQKHWHMEEDQQETGYTAESSNGFRQAFSRWRILTYFLSQSYVESPEFESARDGNIDKAARSLLQALGPWVRDHNPAKESNRRKSLRHILREASALGILLFKQPSTFLFDWQAKGADRNRMIVIRPAFVRRLDEHGEPLRQRDVLLPAKVMS